MARARKGTNSPKTFPNGMSRKQMKRKKPIDSSYMTEIKPLTDNQKVAFEQHELGKNLLLHGAAGTGKTFITLYLALQQVLDENSPYDKIYIVRSLVPTREIGFLPGDHEDKSALYQIPYKNMVRYMFSMPDDNSFDMLYDNLRAQETISFWSTSFIRGVTLDNSIVIVDEFSNLNFHELDSMITRIGEDSKIMFCGDITQTDLTRENDKNGISDFIKILQNMEDFSCIEFGIDDIVRSGLVKSYLIAKYNLGFKMFNFIDVNVNEIDVEPVNENGVRYYPIPGADKYYPSVTSITSFKNAQFFKDWRNKIGETEANRITARATQRGTAFHNLAEDYFKGELNTDKYLENNPLSVRMFQAAKSTLNQINNIHCLETFLYSHYLGLAGRVDCIAEFNGELAVIDFKTSTKEKKEEYIENYFVQETAYAAMFLERSGIEVKKIVTLIATEEGSIQVFEKYNLDDYLQLLKTYIEEFVRGRNV